MIDNELEPTIDRMQNTDFSCLPYIKNRAQLVVCGLNR